MPLHSAVDAVRAIDPTKLIPALQSLFSYTRFPRTGLRLTGMGYGYKIYIELGKKGGWEL